MNWVTRIAGLAWGLRAWLGFALACLISLLVALFVPGKERRQRLVTAASRFSFRVSGVDVTVRGMDRLPANASVVVANHASYVDGVLLNAYLPPQFGFVIKGEMRKVPIAHFLLHRSGSKFVERKEHQGSARDARQIVRAAQGGESLGFFPEGTFRLEPGVGRFRAGAFVAAIKGRMPVVPIAILGTRDMLPSGKLLPKRVPLTVEILPAIQPDDEAFDDHRRLAETARQRILARLGEPDLLV